MKDMNMGTEPRVLVVENDDTLRVLIFTILRHQPLGVDTAASAAEAQDKISKCDYALILVDVDMSDGEGTGFITAFHEQRPGATSLVIAVMDPRNDVYLDPALVSAILHKPIELDTLAEVVRECAHIVPPPEDPLPCPPSESELRMKMEREPYFAN